MSRSLSFNWSRRHHALNAPSTSAILSPYCYRCPVASRFPDCDYLCLKTGMSLADANFAGRPAAVILEPIMSLCLKTGMSLADANFAGRPAAVILEPIMSAGGVIEPQDLAERKYATDDDGGFLSQWERGPFDLPLEL